MTITTSFSNTGKWIKRGLAITLLGGMTALLGACGGGGASTAGVSGGPTAAPFTVIPTIADAYGDTKITFTVSGGKPPYSAASSNSSLFPIAVPVTSDGKLVVTPKTPAFDTPITITFRDSATVPTSITATANLKASTLSSSLTITPATAGVQCTGVCTGSDGVASVQAIIAGVPQAGRVVQFDAFQGDYNFVTPGTNALVSTIQVTTDNQGFARTLVRAKINAADQSAIIQVTDVPSGVIRRFVFPISQVTTSTAISITPSTFAWSSPFKDACVIGGVTNHYISGGVPPYTISATSPDFATFAPSTVTTNGGAVQVITTGNVCSPTGVSFVVRDATARTATFTISNSLGPSTGPSVGSAFGVSPPFVTPATLGPVACGSSASAFVDQSAVAGTTLTLTATSLEPNRLSALISNGTLTVTRATNGVGGAATVLVRVSNSVTFVDVPVALSGVSPFGCGINAGVGTITVGGAASVSVAAGTQLPQTISGGTAPYSVVSANSAIASVTASGPSTFIISGMAAGTTFVTITDSTGASTIIVVTVSAATPLGLVFGGSASASVAAGTTANIGITGGVAPFTISSQSSVTPGRVNATINGNVLTVSAAVGPSQSPAATVVITDSNGTTLTVTINIP